jgi:hypothetical protein
MLNCRLFKATEIRVAKYNVYTSEHYITFLSLTKEVSSVYFHSEYMSGYRRGPMPSIAAAFISPSRMMAVLEA